MIGNDIVDLAYAKNESDWKRPGFLDKIFTEKERQYIHKSPEPERMVWLLWSMKESAYKLHVQLYKKRFFAPKKFSSTMSNLNKKESLGKVVFDDFICFTQSEMSDKYVYTISSLEKNIGCLNQVVSITNPEYKTQHAEIYSIAIAQFAEYSSKSQHHVYIKKNDHGIPYLYFKNEKMKTKISISHHGYFGAFAIDKS